MLGDDEPPADGPSGGGAFERLIDLARRRKLPLVVFLYNLIFMLGSGMSVKFFPLFFRKQYRLTPVQVHVVFSLVPVVVTLISATVGWAVPKISVSPVRVMVSLTGAGIACTVALTAVMNVSLAATLAFFWLRGGVLNSAYPVERALIMNNVPKAERARWSALNSVLAFGWSGSAMVGGAIADATGSQYQYTFLATAAVHCAAVLFLLAFTRDLAIKY